MMYIRPTTEGDIKIFKPSREDRLEAFAAGHDATFPDASECVTLWGNGMPLAIGGNCENQVWFVTSYHVAHLTPREKMEFRKVIIEYRDKMLEQYETLWNYVWVGNKSHIRFLKTIGAEFHEVYGNDGQFQLFTIKKEAT
ncbi:hypothetical protein TARRARE_35 [Escherichia phage vB_Ec_Tarrare]|uniref:Internal virion protein A n=1 Tax=Escherichia phage vB_Ec_Tarrare TaxID=3032379 RepID=A0AAF0IEJ6_9CAUD|nr:hypothetical protein TARRARE_35 [Escherichia phage vB_Ec_Tarrare]